MSARRATGILILASLACLLPARSARADNPSLDPAVLKQVKAATVHLEVGLPDGNTAQGSGFFTDSAGVVITNAHVLGMLDADSRPPVRIAVTVNSGEADSKTLPGKLLGVDRDSDLAVLGVAGQSLPKPLRVVSAKELTETADVFIFGFPFGKQLGKNITVSRSSVSSLRKVNGQLKEIQVNGGMHPGNSGGPVINAKGEVVGVSVSIIRGTQLNFAIPGEKVSSFLNGKIVSLAADLGHKDGDRIKMPFRLMVVDPLGRIQNIHLETWTGEPGQRRRPASATQPAPLPTDSERQTIEIPYKKQAVTSVELSLPAKEDPKRVYWMQPSFVNGSRQQLWHGAWAPTLGAPVERKNVELHYQPALNHSRLTELVSDGAFRMVLAGEEHSFAMNSKSTLAERSAAARNGAAMPVHLDYRGFNLNVMEDKKPVTADAELKRDVNNVRFISADLEMDSDGSVSKARANLGRVPAASRELLEPMSEQVLQSLELIAVPVPDGTLKPLQSWKVQRSVLLGNAIVGVPAQADIKYTYLGTRMLNNREIAFLNVSGTVKGLRGAGLNVGGTVSGGSQVALDTGEVLSATMNFKADMDVDYKGRKAKLYGTVKVQVRRDVPAANPANKPKGS